MGGSSSGIEKCRDCGCEGGGLAGDAIGCGGSAGPDGGGEDISKGKVGTLSFKVMSSKPNVEWLSVTVGCLCGPTEREGPARISPRHTELGSADMETDMG